MNRQELKLADQDGQIWMQLILIQGNTDNGPISNDNTRDIIKKLATALHLDGESATKLPSRMSTILRNEQWKHFTTLWCRTAIGKETFNASKWVSMIAHRLDNVSQTPFRPRPIMHLPPTAKMVFIMRGYHRHREYNAMP